MINIESSEYAIDLTDVAKTYKGGIQALRGIEMRVHHGEIFGLLGQAKTIGSKTASTPSPSNKRSGYRA